MSMVRRNPAVNLDGGDRTDLDLIEQILAGHTALFELLMRRYNERVYRAARAIVRDEHEAEDVMQQAYVPSGPTPSRICANSTARPSSRRG